MFYRIRWPCRISLNLLTWSSFCYIFTVYLSKITLAFSKMLFILVLEAVFLSEMSAFELCLVFDQVRHVRYPAYVPIKHFFCPRRPTVGSAIAAIVPCVYCGQAAVPGRLQVCEVGEFG